MRRLVYWIADCLGDHRSYSIRAKTRAGVKAMRFARGEDGYGKPRKVVIEYRDAFDLVEQLLSEGCPEDPR